MKTQITPEIKEAIKELFWEDEEGRTKISLGNCRLDFKKDYFFEKFTKMGVRIYWSNGTNRVYVIAKVDVSEEYDDFSLYVEGWQYIERLKLGWRKE